MILRSISVVFLMILAINSFAQSGEDSGAFLSELPEPRATVKLFPNPAPEYLYVQLGGLEANKVKLALHNIIGNETAAEVEQVDEHQLRVRVKDMAPGYYFLTVKDDSSKFRGTYKFLKR